MAVDNEPEPFWTGDDEEQRVDQWRESVSFREGWGQVKSCGELNGSSGVWVEKNVLGALKIPRSAAWITDCLDTYYESDGAAKRLKSEPIVGLVKHLNIPACSHMPHPSESDIVNLAVKDHIHRLLGELSVAQPDMIVTLGNAALRVINKLAEPGECKLRKLSADDSYGTVRSVRINGRDIDWLPLAHPAAPAVYQEAHKMWMGRRAATA